MNPEVSRFMWLMCFFDLPVGSPSQRRMANRFRNHLKKDGFIMLQFSVYARLCKGPNAVEKHLLRFKGALPKKGSIRCLQITDKQYARMKILLGTVRETEKSGAEQLVLL